MDYSLTAFEYGLLIKCYSQKRNLDAAFQVKKRMENEKIALNVVFFHFKGQWSPNICFYCCEAVVVRHCVRCATYCELWSVLKNVFQVNFGSLIDLCLMKREERKALMLFEEMEELGMLFRDKDSCQCL